MNLKNREKEYISGDCYLEEGPQGIRFLKSRALEQTGRVDHFFSAKCQGSGECNMGLPAGDAENVTNNRQKALEYHGMDFSRLVVANQVHGNRVHVVTESDCGRGALEASSSIPATDSLVTAESGIPLMTFFADCVPVFVVSRQAEVIGIIHAGWKGVSLKNAAKTVEIMRRTGGILPEQFTAVIGPCIGSCCYEIGEEVAFSLQGQGLGEHLYEKDGHRFADLPGAVNQTLQEAGILRTNIFQWDLCTCCRPGWFHSYRRDGTGSGRMAGVLMKKDNSREMVGK